MDIVVLAGGLSTERAVSLVTGASVCRALRRKGHRAILVDLFLGIETLPEIIGSLFDADIGVVFVASDVYVSASETVRSVQVIAVDAASQGVAGVDKRGEAAQSPVAQGGGDASRHVGVYKERPVAFHGPVLVK